MKEKMSELGVRLRRSMIEHNQFREIACDDPRWRDRKQKADCLRDNPSIILEQKDIQQQDAAPIFRLNEHVAKMLAKYGRPMIDIIMQRIPLEERDHKRLDYL